MKIGTMSNPALIQMFPWQLEEAGDPQSYKKVLRKLLPNRIQMFLTSYSENRNAAVVEVE
jgi:hypothetical protein